MNPSTSPAQIEANARSHGLCSRQLRHPLSLGLALEGELELAHFEALLHARWNLRHRRMNEATLLASPHARTKAALNQSISSPAATVFGPRNGRLAIIVQL